MKASEIKERWLAVDAEMVDDYNNESLIRHIPIEETVGFVNTHRELMGAALLEVLNLLIEKEEDENDNSGQPRD